MTDLDGRGGYYTTKRRPSGPRDSGAARWGASRASDFYGSPSTRGWAGPSHKNVESPVDRLVDTVARMQMDLADLRAENRMLRMPKVTQVTCAPRHAAFTTTKVPRFDGTTSWEQYKQVFDVIVSSNGWDNDTAVLQLFSHLEDDALNVALLVPLPRRLTRTGLVGALSAHYGSPGRLADYWR